jgi:hypothetical protein
MGRPNRDEVVSFLRQFKRAALGPPERLEIWRTLKNVDGLLQLGSNAAMRDDYLLQLTPEDYCEGPKDDDDSSRGGKIWIFGMTIGDQEVYIKLKVVGEEPFDKAICLSFHPAERPLNYPFRK